MLGPDFLLAIYENVHPASEKSIQHGFTTIFKRLESEGDAILRLHIQSLLFDLLGTANHALIHELKLLAMSNEYFADLALIYHMDRFVRHKPPFPFTSITSKKHSHKVVANERKKWADIWEAYWGALFLERELLGFTTEDLIWIWQRLLCARFKPVIARYSLNTITESLNIPTEWNERLMEEGIDVKISPVTSKEGSIDSRLWRGNMEPSAPDEKNVIGYEASIRTATDKLVKAFDVTEEKARMKVFRNADLANKDCIILTFQSLKIVPMATCISLATTSDMPRVRRKGFQTIVESYDHIRQTIFSSTLQQFRQNPILKIALIGVLDCVSTLRIETKTKYPLGDHTHNHLTAILSLYQVAIPA